MCIRDRKETDKDVLREQNQFLQEEVLFLRKELLLSKLKAEKDEEISKKLAEELFLIKKRIYDSKQEKKANKTRNQKKRKKGKLPHNQSQNIPIEDQEIELDEEIIDYKLDNPECCPKCGSEKLKEMNNCHKESSEFEVIERRYILKRHKSCLLYTSPSPRDRTRSRMPSSA